MIADGVESDIGTPASHAALVSREPGVPCVVSVRDVRRRIPTGSHYRYRQSHRRSLSHPAMIGRRALNDSGPNDVGNAHTNHTNLAFHDA
jgi:hypothetical protein